MHFYLQYNYCGYQFSKLKRMRILESARSQLEHDTIRLERGRIRRRERPIMAPTRFTLVRRVHGRVRVCCCGRAVE